MGKQPILLLPLAETFSNNAISKIPGRAPEPRASSRPGVPATGLLTGLLDTHCARLSLPEASFRLRLAARPTRIPGLKTPKLPSLASLIDTRDSALGYAILLWETERVPPTIQRDCLGGLIFCVAAVSPCTVSRSMGLRVLKRHPAHQICPFQLSAPSAS